MWDQIKKVISSVAPILGSAVGGPFGAMAAKIIAKTITGDENSDESDILQTLNSTPEALLKLKRAEFNFKIKMKEIGIKESQLRADDRDSARSREEMLIKFGHKDYTMQILALTVTVGFFGLIFSLLFVQIPSDATTFVKEILFLMGGYFGGIITYYFGSSEGSRIKDLMK